MAYRTVGRLSENIYTFTADSSDNKAKYKCEASNIMSPAPLKAEVTLSVLCKYLGFFFFLFRKERVKRAEWIVYLRKKKKLMKPEIHSNGITNCQKASN